MSDQRSPEMKPCPFCGNQHPWEFITYSTGVLRCKCGAEFKGGAVRVCYNADDVPDELKKFVRPAEALILDDKAWPEHNQVSLPITKAFEHSGVLKKWNKRDSSRLEKLESALHDAVEMMEAEIENDPEWESGGVLLKAWKELLEVKK